MSECACKERTEAETQFGVQYFCAQCNLPEVNDTNPSTE